MGGHRDLVAWRKAMALTKDIYEATAVFPRCELYGLVSQIRRAAVSILSNLAEGYGRNSRAELHQFVGVARGSLAELETQIELSRDLGFMTPDQAEALLKRVSEIGRMLTGLREWSAKTHYKA